VLSAGFEPALHFMSRTGIPLLRGVLPLTLKQLGGPEWIRTTNALLFRQTLYRLELLTHKMAIPTGLEPAFAT
jgi:hypothetical protein